VELIRRIYLEQPADHREFATIHSSMLSLLGEQGEFELYDGHLRAIDRNGQTIFDQLKCNDYRTHLHEEVKSWSYMKFPFIASLGPEKGWYRVGPLARLNNCRSFSTPLAEQERQRFSELDPGRPVQSTLAYHWARMIELLHCAEAIELLLRDDDLLGDELVNRGALQQHGIGVLEAPRGTLFHDYEIDDDGLVTRANLIVSTTNNNQAMNESIRQVANHYLDGNRITEPMLNQIEVAIRAYDPCLSCATHALGRMPLEIELLDRQGNPVDRLCRDGSGRFC